MTIFVEFLSRSLQQLVCSNVGMDYYLAVFNVSRGRDDGAVSRWLPWTITSEYQWRFSLE
jgi:hypothetical protein